MIYQRSALKYKWKAISILHEKTKLISAHAAQCTRTLARGDPQVRRCPRVEAARGEEVPRAGTLAKTPLDSEQNNP